MPGKPPLGLSVEVTLADGSRRRWDSDARAVDRPQGLQFRTRQGDGFSDASCTLARRIDTDYVDLNLLDDVVFIGDDGATAYEGRVAGIPRSFGDMHTVTVNCAGWMANARDRKFTEVYVDRDLGQWGDPSLARRQALLTATYRLTGNSVGNDEAGAVALVQQITLDGGAKPITEAVYDAGSGITISAIYYDALTVTASNIGNGDANWFTAVSVATDDAFTVLDDSGNLVNAAAPWSRAGYFTPTTARRYGRLRFEYSATTAATPGFARTVFWRKVAVYGSHGLTRQGADPGGFYASDVITNIASRFCPELNTTGVQATTYPIPHLVFKDPTDPYDAFLDINKFHLWDLGVWENKTLTFRPYDLSDYDWEVRLSDLGVTVDLQGDSSDDLANGIAVNYTDVATGHPGRITPVDDATLKDNSTDNPANAHGLTKWTELTLSSPTTAAAALQIGRIALAEFNLPKAPGTITVTGHIKDRAGHWQQGWRVRAGDTISITDHPSDRPRLITETTWDHDSKTLTISVEGPAHRLDAVLDRITTSLTAANLSN